MLQSGAIAQATAAEAVSIAVSADADRIRSVLHAARLAGHPNLVLGAFGCGAFGNPAGPVAAVFRQQLLSPEFRGLFRIVAFAVLDPVGTGNLKPFRKEMARLASRRVTPTAKTPGPPSPSAAAAAAAAEEAIEAGIEAADRKGKMLKMNLLLSYRRCMPLNACWHSGQFDLCACWNHLYRHRAWNLLRHVVHSTRGSDRSVGCRIE